MYHFWAYPILDYAAGICGCSRLTKSEFKTELWVYKMPPKLSVHDDMRWEPCEVRQKDDMLTLWNIYF